MVEPDERLARWTQRVAADADDPVRWEQLAPGPSVAAVASRISSVPRPFLDERVQLPALAADVLGRTGATQLSCLEYAGDAEVRLGAAIGLWVLASDELVGPLEPPLVAANPEAARALAIDALALRVASASDPLDWLADDTRREEAARTLLLWSGRLPAGEDAETARSMLAAIDSLAQNRALNEAYAEHRHRAEVARRLAEARAKEAAARYTRE
ncbi:phosphohydrolase [Agromyces sp. LHK192]|uniref:phosphohydrolase n=1 Tax=Agromyces sp. LHK192 TaxID=2498704 RepID=UPI000FDC3F04|nr:phosphohydrolase [Agromyces sp. LHK192]